MEDPYSLKSYHYDLPQELIAQHPCSPRDACRLMVVERNTGKLWEMPFHELTNFLDTGDRLVFNDTKVVPARLLGKRTSGGNAEIFLVKNRKGTTWEVLAKPGKKLRPGAIVTFQEGLSCEIIENIDDGMKLVRFSCKEEDFEDIVAKIGHMPLPHYISRDGKDPHDVGDYQTIYAENPGAVAAPTAGLHFSEEMFGALDDKGIKKAMVTLHVGMGTFRPVVVDDIRSHDMHSERYHITTNTASFLNTHNSDAKTICVGTTCCRTLEAAADEEGNVVAGDGDTNIFIYPGYQFRYVTGMLTNFHLPGSSLLMLVSAFAGHDLIKEAYNKAIHDKFRFYSYGDAMLIL
ncbi:MAG: tRNA preQ1(34) S-adenosylmethionine ribosyltransferase-isomerase QueA [Waddliaceae bacterium]|nr:tRNA preQ1(34) S-adenosylmethionine ribosyltransferase-isomerase QueA [Waddliaceae bacterium]